jgi:hypothetical protein
MWHASSGDVFEATRGELAQPAQSASASISRRITLET